MFTNVSIILLFISTTNKVVTIIFPYSDTLSCSLTFSGAYW